MQKDKKSLEKSDNVEKLPAGPNTPRAGPMLLTQVKATENDSPKANPSRETTTAPPRIIMK